MVKGGGKVVLGVADVDGQLVFLSVGATQRQNISFIFVIIHFSQQSLKTSDVLER